jgi:hypothetical protein
MYEFSGKSTTYEAVRPTLAPLNTLRNFECVVLPSKLARRSATSFKPQKALCSRQQRREAMNLEQVDRLSDDQLRSLCLLAVTICASQAAENDDDDTLWEDVLRAATRRGWRDQLSIWAN